MLQVDKLLKKGSCVLVEGRLCAGAPSQHSPVPGSPPSHPGVSWTRPGAPGSPLGAVASSAAERGRKQNPAGGFSIWNPSACVGSACRGAGVQGCRGAGVQGCRVQGRDAEIPFLGMLPGFPVTAGSPRQSHHRLLTTFIRETKEPSSVPADPSSQCWDTQCSIPKVGN